MFKYASPWSCEAHSIPLFVSTYSRITIKLTWLYFFWAHTCRTKHLLTAYRTEAKSLDRCTAKQTSLAFFFLQRTEAAPFFQCLTTNMAPLYSTPHSPDSPVLLLCAWGPTVETAAHPFKTASACPVCHRPALCAEVIWEIRSQRQVWQQ